MKCIATFFLFLAAVAADGHGDEIDMIMQSKGKKANKKKTVPVAGTSACNPQPLDANMLIAKYNMNISDPEHVAALSEAVNGHLQLGSTNQFIQEASDAGRTGALVVDGLSGDTNWPHGAFKPILTVGEINMCEENHGEVYVGVPDGMGSYLYDDETVRVVVQSESYGPLLYESYPWFVNDGQASFTGSHVQYTDYDREGLASFMSHGESAAELIKGFGQVATMSFNLAGQPVGPRREGGTVYGAHYSNTDKDGNYVVAGVPTEADWLMQSLCSSHLEEKHQFGPGIGLEDDIYITNEEWITYEDGKEFVGISAHAINLETQEDWAVGSVTVTGWEKIIEINPQHPDYVVLALSGYNGAYSGNTAELDARNAEYGKRPDGSDWVWTRDICPARIYIGVKGKMEDGSDAPADDFLARNGLRYGKVYGFAIDMSETGPTGGLWRDAFHKPRENGARVDGKWIAIDWQWDGVVKNYRHDGAWDFQIDPPGTAGTPYKWWNANGYDSSGAKTEHLTTDTRPGKTAFIQGSTAGYFGHYYVHDLLASLEAADPLPTQVGGTYYVYQGENDIVSQIELGTGGLYNMVPECPDVVDATVNCDRTNSVKRTFEDIDGLEVINAKEGLFAIIQEDSGNDLGERMFITKLEHDSDGQELTYKFMAQSGGQYNTRMSSLVGIPAGTNEDGGSHEFSGVIDLSGMLAKHGGRRDLRKGAKKGKKAPQAFMIGAGDGAGKRHAESLVPINEKLIALGLQSHNLDAGVVRAFKADRGGQVVVYQPDI